MGGCSLPRKPVLQPDACHTCAGGSLGGPTRLLPLPLGVYAGLAHPAAHPEAKQPGRLCTCVSACELGPETSLSLLESPLDKFNFKKSN